MNGAQIREEFLKYFEKNGHKKYPSSSLVPSDPTVLLTLAGMLQFKPYFLGIKDPSENRATSVQKCVRTIDIEQVGKTARHHTFFEMLGNFSFGDYFKEEAIHYAWDLLTNVFNLDKSKLYAAVYEKDDESFELWDKQIKLPKDRIIRLGEDNNFWSAGSTGPCGPCSEIYYDLGKEYGCGSPNCMPGCDCDRFLEIWNLVFMQYDRQDDGKLNPLSKKCIDTGMGLERIASVMQNVSSNFDADLIRPIIEKVISLINVKEVSNKIDEKSYKQALNIVADHIRSTSYLIADGVVPSNEGRGYVLRRIIRRAALSGKRLGKKEPFLKEIVPTVIELGSYYKELHDQKEKIVDLIRKEEEQFNTTIEKGLPILEECLEGVTCGILTGEKVFKLYDTYGFPYELTQEIAEDLGVKIDKAGFEAEMQKQKEMARQSASKFVLSNIRWADLGLDKAPSTKFVGYETLTTKSKVVGINKEEKMLIVEESPFYVEGGGQASDYGKIIAPQGELHIENLLKTPTGAIVHKVKEQIDSISVGDILELIVNEQARDLTCSAHTATHLLHKALKEVLGDHANQAGSFVDTNRLRFDFAHDKQLKHEELEKIEAIVNKKIGEAIPILIQICAFNEAIDKGAVALFDEKYSDDVRMVEVKDYSLELCGGTHIKNTKDIELFKIKSEGAVAKGVRRIEAVVYSQAQNYLDELSQDIFEINEDLQKRVTLLEAELVKLSDSSHIEHKQYLISLEDVGVLREIVKSRDIEKINKNIDDLQKQNEKMREVVKDYEKLCKKLHTKKVDNVDELVEKNAHSIKDIKTIINIIDGLDMNGCRSTNDQVINKIKSGIAITATEEYLAVKISNDIVNKGILAGEVVKRVAKLFNGKGGGKGEVASGGIKLKKDLEQEFIEKTKEIILEMLH